MKKGFIRLIGLLYMIGQVYCQENEAYLSAGSFQFSEPQTIIDTISGASNSIHSASMPIERHLFTHKLSTTKTDELKEMYIDGLLPVIWKRSDRWQWLNPFAPKEYGNGEAFVRRDPYTGDATGIILFSIKVDSIFPVRKPKISEKAQPVGANSSSVVSK